MPLFCDASWSWKDRKGYEVSKSHKVKVWRLPKENLNAVTSMQNGCQAVKSSRYPLQYAICIQQAILKEISPGCSLEGLMLKLKLQYFGHLMRMVNSYPDAGRDWGQQEKGMTEDGWMASPTRWTWVWVNSRSWWWTGRPGMLRFMGSQRIGHDWATDLIWSDLILYCNL